ncbi:hypothetical protein [Clostridium sp.]|uniref:hypothetical protein n=1 Tax=Clostridium sp. TaxID=1506 RepID=UPI002FC7A8F0
MDEIVIYNTQFVDSLENFMKILAMALAEKDIRVLVSGTFDNIVYKTILDKILNSSHIRDCKIIIPLVTSSGVISRSYINKICNNGGNIRINSQFRKNIVVIGNKAFVLSFSGKYNKQYGIKTHFECCIQTDEVEVVEKICESFMIGWQDSLPLVNES